MAPCYDFVLDFRGSHREVELRGAKRFFFQSIPFILRTMFVIRSTRSTNPRSNYKVILNAQALSANVCRVFRVTASNALVHVYVPDFRRILEPNVSTMYAFLLHVSLMFAHSRYSFPLNVWICGEVGNLFAWRWSVTVVVTVSSFPNRIHVIPRGNVLSARLRVRVSAGSGSVSRRVPGSGLVKTVVDSARPPASTVIEGNLLPIERSTVISGALSDIVVFTPCAVKGPLAPRPRQPLARARRRQPEGGPPPDSRDCDETPSKGKVRVGVNFATKTVTVVDSARPSTST